MKGVDGSPYLAPACMSLYLHRKIVHVSAKPSHIFTPKMDHAQAHVTVGE